jgi:hypothetical protein
MDLVTSAIFLTVALVSLYLDLKRMRKRGMGEDQIWPTAVINMFILIFCCLCVMSGRRILDGYGHPFAGAALGGLLAILLSIPVKKTLLRLFRPQIGNGK